MNASWTCNVGGDCVSAAKEAGYHAYFANGTTAIEITNCSKAEAWRRASQFGRVLHVFE